eukprot:scaffold12377_cov75-Skeletonema_marinoi.AAC.6
MPFYHVASRHRQHVGAINKARIEMFMFTYILPVFRGQVGKMILLSSYCSGRDACLGLPSKEGPEEIEEET